MPSKMLSFTHTLSDFANAFPGSFGSLRPRAFCGLLALLFTLSSLSANVFAQAQPVPGGAANAGGQAQQAPVPPALMKLLQAWSQNSAGVQKLHGEHHRFVYDQVFMVEKRAVGRFYYESPSKGRIDLEPAAIAAGEKSKRVDPKTGQPYKLQAERPERWICDGDKIWQINDAQKQADIFTIPESGRGQNMMDGPLPFLFGMPPKKALNRYKMDLVQQDAKRAILHVLPRMQMDAANWKSATVILDTQSWLPQAVKLMDPTGNLETVYTFTAFKVNAQCDPNAIAKIFGAVQNVFAPDLPKDYRTKVNAPPQPRVPANPGPTVPAVVNFRYKDALAILEKAGLKVEPKAGRPAPQGQLEYVVYQQDPPANTPITKPGQSVTITVFNKAAAQPQPQAKVIPNVTGIFWKESVAQLKALGVDVKYTQGQAARNPQELYFVYQQSIPAGTPVKAGMVVELVIFTAPPQ